jgi:O-acetyl-ADP-ribose deacetylase (regulator of RNase III)
MLPTYKTKDFNLFFFDRNNVNDKVLKTTVENLVKYTKTNNHSSIAFISAANCLGFMDGGSDLGYMNAFEGIQTKVQFGFKKLGIKSLLDRNYIPIGCSMGFKLYDKDIYFVSSPTMMFPQKVPNTENPYHALKSALQLCKKLGVKNVFCPMMCSGYGGYSYIESFELMNEAVIDYEDGESPTFTVKDEYTYNLLKDEDILLINKKQPKIYCNSEFFVNVNPW